MRNLSFFVILVVVTVTGMAQGSVDTNKVSKANKNSPPPVFIVPPSVAKPVQVFDYTQTPVVANRRPVTQQLSGQAVPVTDVQGVQVQSVVQVPVTPTVAYYPVYQSTPPVQALTVPSHTYQQPMYGGMYGISQPGYTVTTGPDGFAYSSFGLGAFFGTSTQSYPVQHRIRVYQGPSINATYYFGSGNGGGGGQYHSGGHRR